MSMKRILGMMLASKMAGRGTRGGLAGGLGGLAAGGLLGGRRGGGGLGRKAGLGALAYMAYRAYQDHQARSGGADARSAGGNGGASTGSGLSGAASGGGLGAALGGIVKSVSDALGGSQEERTNHAPPGSDATVKAAFSQDEVRAAETLSEDKAVLLIRAMVTAANADGTISADERARIMSQADEAGADAEDRRTFAQELANPRPLDELLAQVRDQDTAEEFYLASRMAVDGTTEVHGVYLTRLRERLGLPEQNAAEIDTLAN